MRKGTPQIVFALAVLFGAAAPAAPAGEEQMQPWNKPPIVGVYVHQHWSYNHPYAARTWTMDDWTGYLDGLKKIGFNSVLIWPVLETMPNPLTPSDTENLKKIAQVIELAHNELDMRVFIALCPNVVARDEEASKYTFQERPFFYTDKRINPADAEAMGKMIAWRQQLFEPIAQTDGVLIIDSDPGGYPGSNNLEFAYLLDAHRTMFNKLNPEIELYYWIHAGWEAYCRFYATAEFAMGELPEIHEAIRYIAKANPEPWGLASGRGPHVADELGMSGRVLSYQYGAIEGEPSFPMTNFGTERAYLVGKDMGARGTLGNSQTHCIQLPNAFLFARGANQMPPPERVDYVEFANRLLPRHGDSIVSAWEAINLVDPEKIAAATGALKPLQDQTLETGDLEGLLFGDPQRFVSDLIMMLDTRATFEAFRAAVLADAGKKEVGTRLMAFVDAATIWQKTHDFKNKWYWPRMEEALLRLDADEYQDFYTAQWWKGKGDTPFEQVQDGFAQVETFTPRLLAAMREDAQNLMRGEAP